MRSSPWSGFRRLRLSADWLVIALLAVASLTTVIVHVPNHTTVSPIDEYVYIDYLEKVPSQLVVRRGEETGDFARKYLACHGVRMIGQYPAEMCRAISTEPDEERYPNEGVTSADIYTPLYFATTWVLAQPLMFFGADLVQAARYIGGLWLALAAVALFASMRRLLVARSLAAAMSLFLVGSLPAYWSNTYVSTDATSLAAGAVLLYLGVRIVQREISVFWFLLAGVLVTATKLQSFIPVVAVALVLFVDAWQSTRLESEAGLARRLWAWLKQKNVLVAVATLVGSMAAQGVWYVVRSAIAVGEPINQGVSSPLTVTALIGEFFKFMPDLALGAYDPASLGAAAVIIAGVGALLTVGGVVGLIGASKKRTFSSWISISTLTTATFAAPALAVASYFLAGEYVDLVPRYGMALLPIALACAALLFQNRPEFHKYLVVLAAAGFLGSLTLTG